MESPYFTSHWAYPTRRYFHAPPSKSSPVQKVVEIPVQYVSSNKPNRFDSAVVIQKVFRGYLVRKSVRRIDEIRREVVEIEKRVLEKESVDANERLRLNESLMSLLFKLDSVLGVDFCVRELRKRVIKRVIRLQEIVDEIADVAEVKAVETVTEEAKLGAESDADGAEVKAVETVTEEEKLGTESDADVAGRKCYDDVAKVKAVETVTEEAKLGTESDADEAGRKCGDEEAVSISEGFEETESQTDSSPLMEEEEEEEEKEREEMEVEKSDDVAEEKRSKELLERMVEDNEKMMGLMTELFERNEMQTRLLSALSQRVGQLERAFMCERLRKKKKKNCDGKKE